VVKKVSILGSTGSIGSNTLNVARHLDCEVVALAAGSNIDLLEQQARLWRPQLVAVCDERQALALRSRLPGVRVVGGMEGVEEAASLTEADCVIAAISGTAGIRPTVAAVRRGKRVGVANKEALVSAGAYVMALAAQTGAELIPVDSEHSALFQCLRGEKQEQVRRLILTASGGPFHRLDASALEHVTAEQALRHPNYRMGKKNTIDSSTLMNKGLEVIEAHLLFGTPIEHIDVLVHPQQAVHALVEYCDGSVLAQISEPDMRLPIQYALTYPERICSPLRPFPFTAYPVLEFFPPDVRRFRCLDIAYQAARTGAGAPCYMNAANEVLVERFLAGQIGWCAIGRKLEALMEQYQPEKELTLDAILHIDAAARERAAHA
jgi:1-deoxy-D-xylulose-5-phosphate reductoisomerase